MDRVGLEQAISRLERLLAAPTSDEADIQRLFEEESVILDVLGYESRTARPRLELGDGRWYEPDFLARLPSGVWHVIDLKLPSERVLLERERRNTSPHRCTPISRR